MWKPIQDPTSDNNTKLSYTVPRGPVTEITGGKSCRFLTLKTNPVAKIV